MRSGRGIKIWVSLTLTLEHDAGQTLQLTPASQQNGAKQRKMSAAIVTNIKYVSNNRPDNMTRLKSAVRTLMVTK